jgi:hypothetical protein
MLFKLAFLKALAAGEADLAFRRWTSPQVKVGSRLRTAIGVLEVTAVEPVALSRLSVTDARRSGFDTKAELLAALKAHGNGPVHRIGLRLAGVDPRIALRSKARLSAQDAEEIRARLARLDAASRHGPWTARVLALIEARPAVRAPDLALGLGRETRLFKVDVRKLKELGLTESLEVGYRLSPRGRAWVKRSRGS